MIFKGIPILNVSGDSFMSYDTRTIFIPATAYIIDYTFVHEGNIIKPKPTIKGWRQIINIGRQYQNIILVGLEMQAQAYPGVIYYLNATGDFSMYFSAEQIKRSHYL